MIQAPRTPRKKKPSPLEEFAARAKMERDNFELDRNVHLENQNAFRTAMHEGIIEIKELQKMKKYNKRKEEKSNR